VLEEDDRAGQVLMRDEQRLDAEVPSKSSCGTQNAVSASISQPPWFMVIVRSRSEHAVADLLRAKGYEVFLPLRKVRRQWSDRIRIQELPLFACNLFCRFEPNQALAVLKTSGVFSILEASGKPLPVPEKDIERLQKILCLDPFVDDCERVEVGDVIEVLGARTIRGVITERGSVCRIVISLDSLGRAVSIKVPACALVKINDLNPSIPLNDWGYR